MTPTAAPPALPDDYADWLKHLKSDIARAQQRAALAVNSELVQLYLRIGRDILLRQEVQGWGAKVIDRLARDLKNSFPDMRGWSSSNLKYMRFFAQHCPDGKFGQQLADQLPWFHIVILLTKLDNPADRDWYAAQVVQHGWSRTTLELNIKNRLHLRQGTAVSNFVARLPSPDSALAHDTLKDPYLFDFLGLGDDAHEREIESGLIRHITRFLLELGAGFAFVGRQFRLEVAGDEFFIDLLFYHTRLKCYVVIELKATAFKPEHAGQLNFYLAAVDAQVKAEDDKSTIGLLLCKQQNRLVANMRCPVLRSPSALPSTNCCVICRKCWGVTCRALLRLKRNWRGMWKIWMKSHDRRPTRTGNSWLTGWHWLRVDGIGFSVHTSLGDFVAPGCCVGP